MGSHQLDLKCLATLIRKIILIMTGNQGNATIKYDPQADKLVLWQTDGLKVLPDNLYSKFSNDETKSQKHSISVAASTKAKVTIGEALTLNIPYLSSFVRFESAAQPQTSEFTQ
jgi:hypothetical protein